MLDRLRNFMFFRRYEFAGERIVEKLDTSSVTFLTLTLPSQQIHTDKEIKSICLDNFMNKLRYHFGMFDYVWKAESQANGNIHFHFVMDLYVDKKLCDKLWWDSIELLGYVTRYEVKHKKRTPPTNKIERAKSLRKVIGYATKYIAKIDSGRPIDGQCWYSSKALQTDVKMNVLMSRKDELDVKRKLRNLGIYSVVNDYGEKFYLEDTSNVKALPCRLRDIYKEVIAYHLGRKVCLEGMERVYREDRAAQLKEVIRKRKVKLNGYEEFQENLFALDGILEKRYKPRKKGSATLKDCERIHNGIKDRLI